MPSGICSWQIRKQKSCQEYFYNVFAQLINWQGNNKKTFNVDKSGFGRGKFLLSFVSLKRFPQLPA